MDFNSNLAMFEDHCLEIGISSDLVLDYTLFDDRNVRQEHVLTSSCHVLPHVY